MKQTLNATTPGSLPAAPLPDCQPAGYVDAHTHIERRGAVVCIDPVELLRRPLSRAGRLLKPGLKYSVGIHPYNLLHVTEASLRLLSTLSLSPQVVAIGEAGLDLTPRSFIAPDSIAAPSPLSREELLALQTRLLCLQAQLSEELSKPLILHIVRAFPEIIRLKKELKPSQPWIIHGFRGKPQLARELLSHGFYLSYGRRFNPEAFMLTPPERRLRETDSIL